jgi:Fe2+ transport system protein FeoA
MPMHWKFHRRHRRRGRSREQRGGCLSTGETSLADVSPGRWVKVTGFTSHLRHGRRAHLQAYGIVPGYSVKVLQHSPVTVVQVEHFELALEADLARGIRVIYDDEGDRR